jgi:ADP-ribosylglycohydrolase
MLGAITGDIIGSVYEGNPIRFKEFPLFGSKASYTDDTVLTIAVADAILKGKSYARSLKSFGQRFTAGYGASFYNWLFSPNDEPYNSWGNGSAMRVSPVGFAFNTLDKVMSEAKKSAECTHNHPEGIKGAKATALCIYLARTGENKDSIKKEVNQRFHYDLNRTLNDIRPTYSFKIACQDSVPESIIAFLESDDVEDAIRNAISLGGDADTMACIAGGIAEAYYKVIPDHIIEEARQRLPDEFLEIIDRFYQTYPLT